MNGVIRWLAKTRLLITELNRLSMRMGLFLPTLITSLLTLEGVGKLVLTGPDRLVCEVTRVIGTVYGELLICVTARLRRSLHAGRSHLPSVPPVPSTPLVPSVPSGPGTAA